jgi:alpha-galactosidase
MVGGSGTINLSNDQLAFELDVQKGLNVGRFSLVDGASWLNENASSPCFSIHVDDKRIDGQSDNMVVQKTEKTELYDGTVHHVIQLEYEPDQLLIEHHSIVFHGSPLIETWVEIRNEGSKTVTIERVDSLRLSIPGADYDWMYFTSGWGEEFESIREPLMGFQRLESTKGRSSRDQHPWFTVIRDNGVLLTVSAMWSGNWVFRFDPLPDGGYEISGGLHDWEFSKELQPGDSMESVHVAIALGTGNDLNTTSIPFSRVGRSHWYPQNNLSESLPVEWNHWWSYEDKEINETRFLANVDAAAGMRCELCTLDAGWFGPTDPDSFWYDYRGDWDLVNTVRFPRGIRFLSDHVRAKGLKFGLWCEIEALGKNARLADTHPGYVALRDGERLGYVCFGNPEVQEWAYQMLDRLISEYACDWIKLDFNLDPEAGCNRTDHGHGRGDGLFEHYRGYYRTLKRIRDKHPHVVLENCSSGGLRIDLGILRETHTTFLSDPDWPEHSLQTVWGASTMLAPDVCLHWSWSEWISEHFHQTFNPRNPELKQHQLDYYTRISMLGEYGFSQKLSELPVWVSERLKHHTAVYKEIVKKFVRQADVYRLTGQPKREGLGDRWSAFQYSLPEGTEHLLFVFRLHGAEAERTIYLKNLAHEQQYEVKWLSKDRSDWKTGMDLVSGGLRFDDLQEEDSALILIRKPLSTLEQK